MNHLNFLKRKLVFLLAFTFLACSSIVMAGPNDGLAEGEEPQGGGFSGPITPGAGWSCSSDVPPSFFWGAGEPTFADDGPFTFEGNFCVFVTDSFAPGDAFTIYDNGSPVGSTPLVPQGESQGCTDPQLDFEDPAFSSGVFAVGAGSHSITIEVIDNPFGNGQAFIKVEECPLGTGESRATFPVDKFFDDGNTTEVEVTLSCNTGLPLEQSSMISEGDGVVFVVTDFSDAELDCEVTETAGPGGYTLSYLADGQVNSPDSCVFEDVRFADERTCRIDNSLEEVEVEVTKVWIDENPQFNAQNVAGATWSCSNVAFPCEEGFINECDGGNLDFFGNPGEDSFFVFPDWESGTSCSITEVNLLESGIEVDDSECQGLLVFPGAGASCTIFNTRLFEGIPTLSQYGLGLLALLMLGMGFVAFRRMS